MAVIADGKWNRAAVPTPSAKPHELPTKVVTLPVTTGTGLGLPAVDVVVIVILRILWLFVSQTYKSFPMAVIPFGLPNFAAAPTPSAIPEVPPAKVVTVPSLISFSAIVILRILLLFVSATYKSLPMAVIACGERNCAAAPTPSAKPSTLPAKVVTSPVIVDTLRILWLFVSQTYKSVPIRVIP